MDKLRIIVLLPLLASAGMLQVKAQSRGESVQVTPWVGAFLSNSSSADLPAVDGAGIVEARMTSSPAIGADVEWGLPLQVLRIRASVGLAVLSSVEFANWDGSYSRGTNHHSLGNPQGIGSSVWLLSGAAVLKPWTGASLPYALFGVGMKRNNYSNMAGDLEEALSRNRTRASVHVGLGLLLTRRVRIEVSDHISRQNFVFEVPQMVGVPRPVLTQHDVILTIGYRFGDR